MIKRQDLVKYIKFYLTLQQNTDPYIKSITDEDIEMLLEAKATSLGHKYPTVPKEDEDILICLVRKEIYWKLATVSAPLYKLSLDELVVSKEVRFDHYLKLIQQTESEYYSLINDPSRLTVKQGNILVKKPYNLRSYYNHYEIPVPTLTVDSVNSDNIELSIDYGDLDLNDYDYTNIYYSNEPIMDVYEDNKINEEANKKTIKNHRTKLARIQIDTSKTCYLLLEVVLRNRFKGYSQELEVKPSV